MNVLQTIDLKKYYGSEPNITQALDGVSLSVEQGEFVAVVGTSGSGKSTLLHMMGGLDTPTSGSVVVRGDELAKKNDEELTIFRRRNIGFIFQNYNLVPILNVYENIVLPVELDGDTADEQFMDEIVGMLALEDKLSNMPNNLSGGQQQRVAIARALITKPAIILADEPTGNLDSRTSADVLGLLKRTGMEFNQTIVMITHNNEIAQLADRIVRIEDGRIVGGGRQARSALKMPSDDLPSNGSEGAQPCRGRQARSALKMPSDDLPSNASEGAQPCKGGRQVRRDLGKPSDEMLPGTGKRALPRRGGGRS